MPPLDAYGDLPRVEDIAISPNGNVALLVQADGQRHVITTNPTGQMTLKAPTGENKVRGISWADDDIVLLTNTATVAVGDGFTASKYELGGTIILSVSNPKPELVFSKSADIEDRVQGRYGVRRTDKGTYGYFGGVALQNSFGGYQFNHGRAGLYAVNLGNNHASLVKTPPSEGHWQDWLIGADGRIAALLDVSAVSGVWRVENAQGRELASGIDSSGRVGLVTLGRNGDTAIYSKRGEDGDADWFEVPLTGGASTPFLPDIGVDRLYTDKADGRLIGYRIDAGTARTVMFDPRIQTSVGSILRAFPGRNAALVDWNGDFTRVIVHTDGSADSGTWYLVNLEKLKADPIGADRPAIPANLVGPVSLVPYKAADGLEMDGVLTLPPGRPAKNLPVVVLPHGGPSSHDAVGFDWWAQALASRGYAVFQPNFRGSTNRDGAFQRAGNGEWGRKMQTDISDGLAELARRGVVDPARACIVGASYGGYAALAGVTLQQGIYRCAVSVAGVSDLTLMYKTDLYEAGVSKMADRNLREQLGDPKGFDAVSPRYAAARANAPILLIHGKDDTVVPIVQSKIMLDALKSAGKAAELVTLKGEDHWLSMAETRKQMLAATVAFVEKHNPAN